MTNRPTARAGQTPRQTPAAARFFGNSGYDSYRHPMDHGGYRGEARP